MLLVLAPWRADGLPHFGQTASKFVLGNAQLRSGACKKLAFFHSGDGKLAALAGVRDRVSEEFAFGRMDEGVRRERGGECR